MISPLEPERDVESPLHSQGVAISAPASLVFVSGQVGVRPDGSTGDGMVEQTRIAFDNIARVLAEGDLEPSDIASLRTYVTSREDIGAFVEVARERLAGHRPASTLLVVESLAAPGLLVQVEAVAAR